MAGKRFPVLMFLPNIMFIPIANIRIEPTKDKFNISSHLKAVQ